MAGVLRRFTDPVVRAQKECPRWFGRRARVLAVSIGTLVALALASSTAFGETAEVGGLLLGFEGLIAPSTLPASGPIPVSLRVSGTIKSADGSRVPALKTLTLEFNKDGRLDLSGIPTCRVSQIESTLTAQARKVCGAALIGTGRVGAQIDLPEQAPFDAQGPLSIFNGQSKGGRPELITHLYVSDPAPTTFVTTAPVHQASGQYGSSVKINIPTIAAGQGSLILFDATIHKIIRASCPAPSGLGGVTFPLARDSLRFSDGTAARSVLIRSCTVKK